MVGDMPIGHGDILVLLSAGILLAPLLGRRYRAWRPVVLLLSLALLLTAASGVRCEIHLWEAWAWSHLEVDLLTALFVFLLSLLMRLYPQISHIVHTHLRCDRFYSWHGHSLHQFFYGFISAAIIPCAEFFGIFSSERQRFVGPVESPDDLSIIIKNLDFVLIIHAVVQAKSCGIGSENGAGRVRNRKARNNHASSRNGFRVCLRLFRLEFSE